MPAFNILKSHSRSKIRLGQLPKSTCAIYREGLQLRFVRLLGVMTKSTRKLPAEEPQVDAAKVTRIDADLLIPGKGDPIKNASLVWKEREIVHVGETKSLPREYVSIQSIKVPVLMPGMWDCHGVLFYGLHIFAHALLTGAIKYTIWARILLPLRLSLLFHSLSPAHASLEISSRR